MILRTAQFSRCRTWRYSLSRTWQSKKPAALFIGLNPSTADEIQDDPTIRRCMRFAHAWGYGGLVMANLFAFRATDPENLTTVLDPIGPENDRFLSTLSSEAGMVIAAWGANGAFLGRAEHVLKLLRQAGVGAAPSREIYCLGVTKFELPRHPLYLPKTCTLVPYRSKCCPQGSTQNHSNIAWVWQLM